MRIKLMPDGQLRYCYEVSPEVAFEFSLKSEVGEPGAPWSGAFTRTMIGLTS